MVQKRGRQAIRQRAIRTLLPRLRQKRRVKELEPVQETKAHELGIVVEGVAANDALAEKSPTSRSGCSFLRAFRRQGHGRNGGDDEEDDEVVTGLYVERQSHGSIDDPMELFPVHMTQAGL